MMSARKLGVVAFGVVGTFVVAWIVATSEQFSEFNVRGIAAAATKQGTIDVQNVERASEGASDICATKCERVRNRLDRSELFESALAARERLLGNLREDYGEEYFDDIFVEESSSTATKITATTYRPFRPITDDGPSFERLKRKLTIKILKMQVKLQRKAESSDFGGCRCKDDRVLRDDGVDAISQKDENEPALLTEQYVWATGGHSAAAGHGNLFNESYTAYMERDLRPVFGAIGIDFEGRNYAMGGTDSASEISMCWREVFGDDVDFFTWDYGMTDGRDETKMLHYLYRGGITTSDENKNFPAIVGVHVGGQTQKNRDGTLRDLEEMGMAAFHWDGGMWERVKDGFPDSAAGMSRSELDALPPYVRNYRCGDSVEQGLPYCREEKYTDSVCPQRRGQTSWHPGYKDHAAVGHGLALFLTTALLSALEDLASADEDDVASSLLSRLQSEEDELRAEFVAADLPSHNWWSGLQNLEEGDVRSQVDFPTLFYKGRSVCHTGRLPSQTRYLGYLADDTTKVGSPAPLGRETYEVGIDQKTADETPANGTLRLVYETGKVREKCKDRAVVTVNPDHNDFFYGHHKDGWSKLTFPNGAERTAYNYDPAEHEGVIVFHMMDCPWGKCPKGNLVAKEDYKEQKWEIKVNDVPVSSLVQIGHGASLAVATKGADGGGGGEETVVFPPNADGVYDIEVRVNEPGGYVRISSIVLY